MPEAVSVRIGNGVGDLDGDFNGTTDVQGTAGSLGTKRLPFLELEGQIHPGIVFAAIEKSRDIGMRERAQSSRPLNQPLSIDSEISRQQAHRNRASELGVARPIEIARPGRLQALEQVVVSDDPNRGGRRRGHVCLASMTLCTSSFASLICSSTIVMSIVGRPGCRAL